MSTFTSSNGTRFNFKLDNGLPYKPILETTFKLFSQKNNKNAGIIQIFLESNDLNNSLDSIVFESFSIDDKEAYLDIGKFYIYIEHNNEFFYKSAQDKTLFVELYSNEKFLFGAYIA